tara:strand:- start:75497 stop:75709 length:213 start_codon:yes stop_codon:yes gene_type:complete
MPNANQSVVLQQLVRSVAWTTICDTLSSNHCWSRNPRPERFEASACDLAVSWIGLRFGLDAIKPLRAIPA